VLAILFGVLAFIWLIAAYAILFGVLLIVLGFRLRDWAKPAGLGSMRAA